MRGRESEGRESEGWGQDAPCLKGTVTWQSLSHHVTWDIHRSYDDGGDTPGDHPTT